MTDRLSEKLAVRCKSGRILILDYFDSDSTVTRHNCGLQVFLRQRKRPRRRGFLLPVANLLSRKQFIGSKGRAVAGPCVHVMARAAHSAPVFVTGEPVERLGTSGRFLGSGKSRCRKTTFADSAPDAPF